MAPAAQAPSPPQIITLTHTQRVTKTATMENTHPVNTRTQTRTERKTVTLFSDEEPTSPLFSPQCPSTIKPTPFHWPSQTDFDNIAPRIHGIVPGLHADWHSLRTASPKWETRARTTLPTSASLPPRTSDYPRPSPPGILYPSAIVPPAAYAAQQPYNPLQHPRNLNHARTGQLYHPSLLGRMDYELAYLPYGLKVLFFWILMVTALASAWTVLVWLVNFPPGTWPCFQDTGRRKGRGKERRPVDKPSRYALLPSSAPSAAGLPCGRAVTSAMQTPLCWDSPLSDARGGEMGIELTHRPQQRIHNHRRQRTQDGQHIEGRETYKEHRRTASSPIDVRFSIGSTPTASVLSSPENPYLAPPCDYLSPHAYAPNSVLKPRNSSEWLDARAAFFSSAPKKASPTSSLHRSTPSDTSTSSYSLNTADMNALEAGTAPLTGHSRSRFEEKEAEESVVRKSLSWLDLGLGMMDGAVDRFTERVARWTDDEGGDEPLLLPVANGKMVKVD